MFLRKKPIAFYLNDFSALVNAILLGIALPPLAPWWVSLIATAFAILFAKHLYGGMGYNPFNPAMVGYALVLVSFPVPMTTNWASPGPLLELGLPSLSATVASIWEISPLADAYSGATPLDLYKHEIAQQTSEVVRANPIYGGFVSLGWEWVNLAFLGGGIVLLLLKIIQISEHTRHKKK